MCHPTEEQLVRLFVNGGSTSRSGSRQAADGVRRHLAACPECRAKYDKYHELGASLGESPVVPPISAWPLLKRRVERSRRPGRDWTEPGWLSLVSVHLGVVVVGLAAILLLGWWLESSAVWESMARFPLVRTIGPRGLIGLVFIAGGGLCVLALTPVLWWESRTRG